MFIYQPMLDSLELKKDKDIDYVFSCKSKGVYNSKLKPLITAFLYSIKLSEYRIGKNSIKILLTVEKKLCDQVVNIYIAYYLDAWQRNPSNNFKFKN